MSSLYCLSDSLIHYFHYHLDHDPIDSIFRPRHAPSITITPAAPTPLGGSSLDHRTFGLLEPLESREHLSQCQVSTSTLLSKQGHVRVRVLGAWTVGYELSKLFVAPGAV